MCFTIAIQLILFDNNFMFKFQQPAIQKQANTPIRFFETILQAEHF